VKTAPRPSAGTKSRPEFLIFFGLVAAGLAIYAPTLSYGFITFDDPGYVYENPHVVGGLTWAGVRWAFTSVEQSNWHPLTWLSLLADAQLYGLHAGGYHLTNLVLHLANAVLLFLWLRAATGAVWPAALTAFFFVAHPLHVESVAWVTERKDVLSTLFFCLTLLAYTRYARGGGRRFYGAALGCYALGLLAKPMLVSLPALLLLLDYWPLRRWAAVFQDRRKLWPLLADKLPFLLLAALSCAVTLIVQHHGAAVVPLAAEPIRYRVGAAFLGYATYVGKTFYPVRLGIYYPFWRGESYVLSLLWGGLLAGVFAGALRLRRRMPWLVVGWCWFIGTLIPVIGLVQVGGQAVADRYTYLPHIGLFLMIFWTAADVWERHPAVRAPLLAAVSVAAAACVALSMRQVYFWRSSASLFEHTLQVAAPSGRLYHLLGDALLEEHQADAAGAAYRQAFRLQPLDKDVALQLGVIDLRQQRWTEAEQAFGRLAAEPDPDVRALNDDALALVHLGRVDDAKRMYERALAKDGSYALAHFGLADLLLGQGEAAAAVAEYERGLELRDDWVPALAKLAWIDAHGGDGPSRAAALILAGRAVGLSQGEDLGSLDALAAAEAAAGRWDRAVDVAGAALELAAKPGAAPGAAAICRERLELYRKKQMALR
jgi:tetratricopeptide (TPR) repeat protein